MAAKNASLSTAVLEVEWFGHDGSLVIEGQTDINITGESNTMDSTLTSRLTFTSLKTSQGGVYTCSVNLTIREANVIDHNVRSDSSVRVKSEYIIIIHQPLLCTLVSFISSLILQYPLPSQYQ